MRLSDVLDPRHVIVPLPAETLRGAVLTLVQRLVETGAVARPDRLERLMNDERIRDVVHVGDRVLLPHLRTDAVDHLVVAIGVSPQPLLTQTTQEHGRARVVILVLAPPESASRYLQVVGALASALRSDSTVNALTHARTPEDVLSLTELRDLKVQPTLTVRDVMSTQTFRVYPDTPVREILDLMRRHQLRAVPVVGEKREVLGVVSEGDILRHLLPMIGRAGGGDGPAPPGGDSLYDTPVREIMSRSVMCISEDQALTEVVSTMINKNVERLPVVQEGRLTGFLTRADVMRKLFAS
jgi:CBS domain-containing protein